MSLNYECKYWHNTFVDDIKIFKEEWPPDEMPCCKSNRVIGTIDMRLKKRDNSYVKISLQHLHTKDQISLLFLVFDTTKKRELVFWPLFWLLYINYSNPRKLNIYCLLLCQIWYYRYGYKRLNIDKIRFKFYSRSCRIKWSWMCLWSGNEGFNYYASKMTL